MDTLLTATELAAEFDITARTLRFYETKGLLSPRRAGTTRVYSHRDRGRLQLILRGKRLGFSLADIREYLDCYDADNQHVEQLLLLVRKVRDRMARLRRQRDDLELTLAELGDIDAESVAALKQKGVDPEQL